MKKNSVQTKFHPIPQTITKHWNIENGSFNESLQNWNEQILSHLQIIANHKDYDGQARSFHALLLYIMENYKSFAEQEGFLKSWNFLCACLLPILFEKDFKILQKHILTIVFLKYPANQKWHSVSWKHPIDKIILQESNAVFATLLEKFRLQHVNPEHSSQPVAELSLYWLGSLMEIEMFQPAFQQEFPPFLPSMLHLLKTHLQQISTTPLPTKEENSSEEEETEGQTTFQSIPMVSAVVKFVFQGCQICPDLCSQFVQQTISNTESILKQFLDSAVVVLHNGIFQKEAKRMYSFLLVYLTTFCQVSHDTIISFWKNVLLTPCETTFENASLICGVLTFQSDICHSYFAKSCSVAHAAVCIALVNIYDAKLLLHEYFLFDDLMDAICNHAMSTEISKQLFGLQTLATAVKKSKEFILSQSHLSDVYSLKMKQFLQHVLQVVWNNWENPIKNIYEKVRDMFQLVMDTNDTLQQSKVPHYLNMTQFVHQVMESDWNSKGKYPCLLALTQRMGIQTLLQQNQQLLFQLLQGSMHNFSVNNSASVLYEEWSNQLFKLKDGLDTWQNQVLLPMAQVLLHSSTRQREGMIIYVFPKILKIDASHTIPKMVHFLQQLYEQVSEKKDWQYSNYLYSLIHICKFGKLLLHNQEVLSQVLKSLTVEIEHSLIHEDADLRLHAMDMIGITVKSTSCPTSTEMNHLLSFVMYNVKNATSHFRSKCSEVIRRFLERCIACAYKIHVKFVKSNSLSQLSIVTSQEEVELLPNGDVKDYALINLFSSQLITILKQSLYPNCPHEKFLMALQLYKLCLDNFLPATNYLIIFTQQPNLLFDSDLVYSLMNSFLDCWDKVRSYLFDILSMIPCQYFEPVKEQLVTSALQLMNRSKLRECDAGSLLFRIAFHKLIIPLHYSISIDEQLQVTLTQTSQDATWQSLFLALESQIAHRLSQIQQNLFCIASTHSLVGFVLAYRYCFHDLCKHFLKTLSNASAIKDHLHTTVELTKQIIPICLQVIADAQFDNETNPLLQGAQVDCRGHVYFDSNSQSQQQTVDAHSLVVNTWLVVKELALLLGTFVELIPLELLSVKLVQQMGEILLHVLLTSKHNGVLEKGHVGFAMMNRRLLQQSNSELRQLPCIWLQQVMDKIKNDEKRSLRRSAGLPFTFLAILKSEPLDCPKILLPQVLNTFLEWSQDESCHLTTRIHSMNLLKFLINDAALSEDVNPFIERTFFVVMNGFASEHWTIKNSSLMCYSALLLRSVGCKKTKEEHETQNSAKIQEFFAKFPLLKDFLKNQLQIATTASQSSQEKVLHPSLYPILLLLSRLAPSWEEEVTSVGSQFVDLVKASCRLPHYMARCMAARALVPLINSKLAPQMCKQICLEMKETKNSNWWHGSLCQVNQLFQISILNEQTFDITQQQEICKDMLQWLFENDILTLIMTEQTVAPLCQAVLLDLIYLLLTHMNNVSSVLSICKWIQRKLIRILTSKYACYLVGKNELYASATKLYCHQLSIIASQIKEWYPLLQCCLQHPSIEAQEESYQFLKQNPTICISDLPLRHYVLSSILSLVNTSLQYKQVMQIRHWMEVLVTAYTNHYVLLQQDLELLSCKPDQLFSLLQKLFDFYSNTFVKEQVLHLMGVMIPILLAQKQNNLISQWCTLLWNCAQPDTTELLRNAVQSSIAYSQLFSAKQVELQPFQFIAWKCCIQLLQDEEEDIRANTCKVLANQFFTPAMRYQVVYMLEQAFGIMTQRYSQTEEYCKYLMSMVKLQENSQTGKVTELQQLIKDNTLQVELFEKEEDNLFIEQVYTSQLAMYQLYLMKDSIAVQQQWEKLLQKSITQLQDVIEQWKECNKSQFALIGGISYHTELFLLFYKPLLGCAVAYQGLLSTKAHTFDKTIEKAMQEWMALHQSTTSKMHPMIRYLTQYLQNSNEQVVFDVKQVFCFIDQQQSN